MSLIKLRHDIIMNLFQTEDVELLTQIYELLLAEKARVAALNAKNAGNTSPSEINGSPLFEDVDPAHKKAALPSIEELAAKQKADSISREEWENEADTYAHIPSDYLKEIMETD